MLPVHSSPFFSLFTALSTLMAYFFTATSARAAYSLAAAAAY